MARPTLLNFHDPAFPWEHAMAHRNFIGVMSPLPRFTVIPYFIDPFTAKRPGDNWHMNHRRAHDDADDALPDKYLGTVGFGVSGILVDSDLNDPVSRSWWTFINHTEHYVESNNILPQPQMPPPPPAPIWVFPFW